MVSRVGDPRPSAQVAFSLPLLAKERKFCVQSLTRELSPSLVAHARANAAVEAALEPAQNAAPAASVTPMVKKPLGATNVIPEDSPMTTINSFLQDAATKIPPRAESPEGSRPQLAL